MTELSGPSAVAADLSSTCAILASKATASGALYALPQGGNLKDSTAITLEEMRGQAVDFFYLIKRSPERLWKHRPNSGALSVKSEMWQPREAPFVHLFNNHLRDNPSACPGRDLSIYQEFHRNGNIDNCLGLAFHNQNGFNTREPAHRRKRFLFPERSFFDLLFRRSEQESVKRQSGIVNYNNPADGSPICLRFQATLGQEITRFRLIVDDLYEDVENQTAPAVRLEVPR